VRKRLKYTLAILLSAFLYGCAQDFSVVDHKETRVVVDSFVQADMLQELDVLVSLDTSGSMRDNYDDVASGIEVLRSDIESLTIDYRFGYITMDPSSASYLGPYDASSTAIDMLMAPSLLPSTSLEEGFAAVYSFLNSEDAIELRRESADFLLFLISDEDEQSSITAAMFNEWLNDEFKNVQHDVVVITQLEGSDCGYTYDIGYKYQELASIYSKDAIDICKEDWSAWLSASSYLTEVKDYIQLSDADPIVESIVVYENQIVTYDWEYLEEINTVQLGFMPDHGAIIEVGYKVYIN
tara:strand:+ start:1693 stop:2580 length:888 start_codon:yes stop_codon:yes gene_type:complete